MINLHRTVGSVVMGDGVRRHFLSSIIRENSLFHRLGIHKKIAKKIGYGYAIAIGMAILGTTAGLCLGNYYSRQAQNKVDQFTEKQQLLEQLNSQVLGLQLHPLRLLAVDSIWQEYEMNQFMLDVKHLQRLLVDIEQFSQTAYLSDEVVQQALMTLSDDYTVLLTDYETSISLLWDELNDVYSSVTATETIAQRLSNEQSSRLSLRFETLSEDLTRLRQTAELERQLAIAQRQQAAKLRFTMIVTSIVLSTGLAVVLAVVTSQAIARPIEKVTAVAHQVTQSADFTLQAPIVTEDEVALLTQALNQLILWTGEYTEALELARDTLEERVEERTMALQQSEDQLRQQTLDLQATLTELQQTQLHLVQSEKMSSLGQMVAGVAHEINNPTSFIYGNLSHIRNNTVDLFRLIELYQAHYPKPHPEITAEIEAIDLVFLRQDFPSLIASVHTGAQRIKEIVTSLRMFSRLDEATVKRVNIHDGLDSTLTILNNRLKGDRHHPPIQVRKHYADLPAIECYAGQLNQVFMNILSNSIEALYERFGQTANVPKTDGPKDDGRENKNLNKSAQNLPQIDIYTECHEQWISIQITDNGPGIEASIRQKLFDPFFTTKEVGKGTGLGLSISYQIVTQTHHGELTCDSTAEEGTTFMVKLPLSLDTTATEHVA